MSPELSIIIPAYNEAQRIAPTLEALKAYADSTGLQWETWVVMDGCTDNTRDVLEPYLESCSIQVIDRRENRGKGYTIKEGMLAAQGKIRLMMDADASTSPEHFELMRPCFERGADVVCCSRHKRDAAGAVYIKKQPWPKPLMGKLGNLFIQATVLPGIWDSQCGFKAFTAEAAEKLFSHCEVDGWAWDIEVLALARHFDLNLEWVPARWVNHPDSSVLSRHYLQVLQDAWAIRRRIRSGAV